MDTPILFSKVLVISGSSVFRHLLRLILEPHSEAVLVACDRAEGWRRMARSNSVEVVICEVELPDGDGFDVLKDVASIPDARPDVLLVAAQPGEADARRAIEEGAVGYLAKPVSFRDIASALNAYTHSSIQRAGRRRPGGRVSLLAVGDEIDTPDAAFPQLLWYARDISFTGAFLETESPVPVGSRLDLFIEIGCTRIRVKAEVVRIQEPTWGCGGGVGVEFFDYGDSAKEVLRAYVAEGGPDSY